MEVIAFCVYTFKQCQFRFWTLPLIKSTSKDLSKKKSQLLKIKLISFWNLKDNINLILKVERWNCHNFVFGYLICRRRGFSKHSILLRNNFTYLKLYSVILINAMVFIRKWHSNPYKNPKKKKNTTTTGIAIKAL